MKPTVLMVFAVAAVALTVTEINAEPAPQSAKEIRGATPYAEIKDEPATKLIVDPPLPDLLANKPSVVWIQYRVENVHIVPVFGKGSPQHISTRRGGNSHPPSYIGKKRWQI